MLAACGGEGPSSRVAGTPAPAETTQAPAPSVLPEHLAYDELAKLSAAGNAVTYQASYRSASGPQGKVLLFTKYRKPPRDRQDVLIEGSSDVSASFLLPEANYVCARSAGKWSCRMAPGVPSFSTDPAALGKQLREQLGEIKVSDRTIAGERTRCFSGKSKQPPGASPPPSLEYETCFTSDGVPLRLRTAELALDATSFSRDVPDRIFDLPGPVEKE